MDIQTIRFGDEGQVATRELLKRFEALRPEIATGTSPAMTKLREHLRTLDGIDRQYGGEAAPLPLEGADELVAAAITDLAHLESDCRREGFDDASLPVAELAVGVALWALRHGVALTVVEPVANALALLSNEAPDKPGLSAVYGLMHGIVGHVSPALSPDLERSDPMRPWRLLNVNLAITAIRTEDEALITQAFDQLDRALPDERAGFYAEALAIAMGPRIDPKVRSLIEERHRRWNMSYLSAS